MYSDNQIFFLQFFLMATKRTSSNRERDFNRDRDSNRDRNSNMDREEHGGDKWVRVTVPYEMVEGI